MPNTERAVVEAEHARVVEVNYLQLTLHYVADRVVEYPAKALCLRSCVNGQLSYKILAVKDAPCSPI